MYSAGGVATVAPLIFIMFPRVKLVLHQTPDRKFGESLRQHGLLEAALCKQKAAIADEIQFSPIHVVEHGGEALEVGRLQLRAMREQRQDRAVVVVARVQKEGLRIARAASDVNARID